MQEFWVFLVSGNDAFPVGVKREHVVTGVTGSHPVAKKNAIVRKKLAGREGRVKRTPETQSCGFDGTVSESVTPVWFQCYQLKLSVAFVLTQKQNSPGAIRKHLTPFLLLLIQSHPKGYFFTCPWMKYW